MSTARKLHERLPFLKTATWLDLGWPQVSQSGLPPQVLQPPPSVIQ
jgi:hypothetical protein